VGCEQRRTAIALLAALIAQTVAEGARDDLAPVRDRGALGGRDD
jgi:hypothetical protein